MNVVGFRKSGTDGLVSIFKIAVADSCGVGHKSYSTSPSNGMLTNSTNSVSVKKRYILLTILPLLLDTKAVCPMSYKIGFLSSESIKM